MMPLNVFAGTQQAGTDKSIERMNNDNPESNTFCNYNWLEESSPEYTSMDEYELDDGVKVSTKGSLNTFDTESFETPSKPVSLGDTADDSYIQFTNLPAGKTLTRIELDMIANNTANGVKVTVNDEDFGSKTVEGEDALEHVVIDRSATDLQSIKIQNTGTTERVSLSNIELCYENVQHTVTFDPDNEDDPWDAEVNDGEKVAQPEDPVFEGHVFEGWFAPEATEKFNFDTPITADLTLTAHWTEVETHTATFDPDGGTVTDAPEDWELSSDGKYTKEFEETTLLRDIEEEWSNATIDKEGKEFDGWGSDAGDGQTVLIKDVNWTAQWKEITETHTVTFQANPEDSGTFVDNHDNPVDTIEDVPVGTKYGIEDNEDFYLRYNPDSRYQYIYVRPTPSPGFVFDHWDVHPASGTVTDDMVVTAVFVPEEMYTVSFVADPEKGGTIIDLKTKLPVEDVHVLKGTEYSVDEEGVFNLFNDNPSHPIIQHLSAIPKDGYIFKGWRPSTNGIVTGDMTVEAVFESAITHTVTFSSTVEEGATGGFYDVGGSPVEELKIVEGTTFSVETLNPKQNQVITFSSGEKIFALAGRYTCIKQFEQPEMRTITEDCVFRAIFEPLKCTVTFDSMGGSEVDDITVPYGTVIEEPEEPTKDNANFTGWFTDYARGYEFDFSEPITEDITLYAGWQNTVHEEWLFNNEATGWEETFDFGVFDNATKYNGLWIFNGIDIQTDYYHAGATVDEQYASFNSNSKSIMNHGFGIDIPEGKMLERLTIGGCVADEDAPVRVVIRDLLWQELASYELSEVQAERTLYMPDCVDQPVFITFEMDTTEASPEARIMSVSADFEDFAVPEVTGFKAYATGTDTAEIHWDKAADSRTNYYLYRSQDPKGDWGEPIAVLSNDQNEYVDNDVEVGNTYYYTVRGGITMDDTVIYGPYSNIDYARPVVPQVNDFVAYAPTYNAARVEWAQSTDSNAIYFLYKGYAPTGDWGNAIEVLGNDVTQFDDPNAETGVKAYYMVRAAVLQEDGTYLFGPYTNVDYAYPRVAEVTGFQAWAPNDQVATVAWDQAKDPNVVYFLYKGSQPTGDWGNAIKILPNGTQKYVDIDVTTGTKTYYMVRAAVKQDDGTYLFGPYTKVDYAWPR